MAKIINMGEQTNNGALQSPKQALECALEDIDGGRGAFAGGKKVLILALDDNDQYSISFRQAGMKVSECIALCEIAKTLFLSEMDYI